MRMERENNVVMVEWLTNIFSWGVLIMLSTARVPGIEKCQVTGTVFQVQVGYWEVAAWSHYLNLKKWVIPHLPGLRNWQTWNSEITVVTTIKISEYATDLEWHMNYLRSLRNLGKQKQLSLIYVKPYVELYSGFVNLECLFIWPAGISLSII